MLPNMEQMLPTSQLYMVTAKWFQSYFSVSYRQEIVHILLPLPC